MDTARTSLRQIAALASVVRGIVDGIKEKGRPPVVAQYAALDAVDAFVQGGKLTKKDAERLSNAVQEEVKEFGVSSPPAQKAAYWVSGPVARLLRMTVRGDDDRTETLTQAGYALGSLHKLSWGEYDRRIKESYAKALEAQAHLSDAPLGERPKRVNRQKASVETELLARSRAALPPWGQVLLDRIGAERDAKQVGTREQLLAMLEKHGYPAWDAVLRFDEDFGGLLVPYGQEKRWREDNVFSICGSYAGLKAGGDRMRMDGLVPVYFAANDMIGFLDEKGEAWLGGVIDGQLSALHRGGADFLAASMAFDLLQTGGPKLKGVAKKPGLVGEPVAKELGLEKVADYGPAKLWASGDAVVSEFQGTQVAAFTDEAWKKAQHAVAGLDPSPADLFEALRETKTLADVDRAYSALLAAIAACDGFGAVKQLFAPWVMQDLFHPDVEPRLQEVASALMKRAGSMNAEEGGNTVGWVARQAAGQYAPKLDGWSDASKRRSAWCDGINEHIGMLRGWTRDPAPERRVASAYVLPWCPSATKDDAELLLGALEKEKDPEARATELLVLGFLATKPGADRDQALRALRKPEKPSTLVAACAVAGLVWLGEPLSHAEVEVLLQHLRRSTKVPAVWQWEKEDGGPTGTGQLGRDATRAMTVAEGDRSVTAMLAMLADPKLPKASYHPLKVALARGAFEGRREAPRQGVAVEELSARDRGVLAALVDNSRFVGSVYGLNERDLREMLEQKLPEWRPIEVTVKGKLHHWHFARILGAVAVGEIDPDAARDIVLRAFTAAEAANLASSWSRPLLVLEKTVKREEERGRVLAACLGILDETKTAGVDVDALCRDYLKNRSADWGVLMLWSIRAHRGHPPEEHLPLFNAAMSRLEWHAALLAAVKGLPAEVRREVLHKAGPWVFDFWDGALDEVTVPNLVLMTLTSRQRTAEVIAMLKAAGPEAIAMALAVTSDKPPVEASLALFREALRKATES
jgi:hypothetical protein